MSLQSTNPPASIAEYLASAYVTAADIAAVRNGATSLIQLPGYTTQFPPGGGLQWYTGGMVNQTMSLPPMPPGGYPPAPPGAYGLGGGAPAAPSGGIGGAVQQAGQQLIGQGTNWLLNQLFGGSSGGPPAVAQAGAMGGGLPGAVGGAIAGAAPDVLRALTKGSNGGCGCHSRGACGKHEPAPLASFFGGNCPPGRVLRRQPWARDICIKKPKMNPLNPCALRRANRRLSRFAGISAGMLRRLGFVVQAKRPVVKLKGKRRGR